MNNLLKKISSLYKTDHMVYKYQIGYYADLSAMLLVNIMGLVMFSAPFVLLGLILWNTPSEQFTWSILTQDLFYGMCLFNFFYFGLNAIFFIHNKGKFCSFLIKFNWSWMALAVAAMVIELCYYFILYNFKMISNPQEYIGVLYLDIALFTTAALIYVFSHPKVKAFFDNFFTPYRG